MFSVKKKVNTKKIKKKKKEKKKKAFVSTCLLSASR